MGRIYYLLLATMCVAMLGCKKEQPKREESLRASREPSVHQTYHGSLPDPAA